MSHIVFIISQILSIVYNFTIYIKPRFSFDYHSKKGRAGELLQKIKLRLRKLQRPKSWEQKLGWKCSVLFRPLDLFWHVRGLLAAPDPAEGWPARLLPRGR